MDGTAIVTKWQQQRHSKTWLRCLKSWNGCGATLPPSASAFQASHDLNFWSLCHCAFCADFTNTAKKPGLIYFYNILSNTLNCSKCSFYRYLRVHMMQVQFVIHIYRAQIKKSTTEFTVYNLCPYCPCTFRMYILRWYFPAFVEDTGSDIFCTRRLSTSNRSHVSIYIHVTKILGRAGGIVDPLNLFNHHDKFGYHFTYRAHTCRRYQNFLWHWGPAPWLEVWQTPEISHYHAQFTHSRSNNMGINRRSHTILGMLGPATLGWSHSWPPRKMPSPMHYHIKYGHSTLNSMSLKYGCIGKMGLSLPTFQSHSRSL